MNNTPKHTISLFVANKPGVLNRIALVFSRRGYNIDSLVVSPSKNDNFSQMNIVASGDERTLDQILKQLNKLVDVVHADDYSGDTIISKEMAIIKVSIDTETRMEILQVAQAFECETVDFTDTTISFLITGETIKLDSAENIFENFGILEIMRTGQVIMARGNRLTATPKKHY
ncbi:acetolactate synthase small subunit [Spirochaeta cellobiosiphila]|uniref:acetolactate synthase small subunit n=1 Tax=Spirochaeta cellobiosiphila TaxID=504483 RepID=UPI000421CFE9|nr:acetolactate synthase small subunit [Spirochaeta cellobiosiphila]